MDCSVIIASKFDINLLEYEALKIKYTDILEQFDLQSVVTKPKRRGKL